MRKAVLFLALLTIVTAGCGGGTVLPTGLTAPTRAPTMVPSPFPSATLPPTPTSTPEMPAVPVLEYPTARTVMDNGRSDGLDRTLWFFDWSDVPGAVEYELLVTHGEAANLVVQEKVLHSSYYYDNPLFSTSALVDWEWKVRARIGDQWGAWSEQGVFIVEQVDTDPKMVLGEVCNLAELPVDRSGTVEPISTGLPEGLAVHEYLLEKDSVLDHSLFAPVGTTQEEVEALHAARRGALLLPSAAYDKQPENFPDEKVHRPVPFRGADLVAIEYLTYEDLGMQISGKVTLGGSVVYEVEPWPAALDYLFREVSATETDWYVETAYYIPVEGAVCFLGDVIQSGESLSARYGYREAFGFQLLGGKPFYFFNQSDNIGFSYDGKVRWLGYDEVPKYAEEYGSAMGGPIPRHWENAVAFFARRGDDWYYVEIVKAP